MTEKSNPNYPDRMDGNWKGNRKQHRCAESLAKRPQRDSRIGFGKRAMAGNKFRHIHVNWFVRICKEMKQSKRVQDWINSPGASAFVPKPTLRGFAR